MGDRTIRTILRAEIGQYKQAMGDAAKATEEVAKAGVGTEQQHRKMQATAVAAGRAQMQTWTKVGGALTLVGGGMTALSALTLKTGVAYNQLQQSSRAALTTLLGGADAANAQMDKLDAFARNSPFAKQVFIQAQQQMLGFGIETRKVLPYLDAIQQSVAATGGSNNDIAELSRIISQISASAKITATDLREFGNRGIDAATIIGSQMGMTGAQIRDSITAGTLDAGQALDALAAGMQDRFGGAADNVKNTFAGALDRVSAAWRDLSSEIAEPFVGKEGGGLFTGLANETADFLRGVQSLPGPVKTTGAAIFGLTGVTAAVGGAFLLALPRIMETRAALANMGPVANGAASALGKVGKAAGVLTTAFIALKLASEIEFSQTDQVAGINAYERAIRDMASGAGDAGDALDELFTRQSGSNLLETNASQHIKGLDDALRVLTDGGVKQFLESPLFGDSRWDLARESIAGLDAAMTSMVDAGNIEAAADMHGIFAEKAIAAGHSAEDVAAMLPAYADALVGVENATEGTAGAADRAREKHEQLMEAWHDSRKAAAEVAGSFDTFSDSASDAEVSLGGWIKQIEEQARALRKFRENAEEAGEKGLNQGLIKHLESLGADGALRLAEFADASEAEIRRANRAWRSYRDEVNETVDNLAGKKPKLEVDDSQAKGAFERFFTNADKAGRTKPKGVLDLFTAPAEGGFKWFFTQAGKVDKAKPKATLDADDSPAKSAMAGVLGQLDTVDSARANPTVDANVGGALSGLAAVRNAIASIPRNVNVNVNRTQSGGGGGGGGGGGSWASGGFTGMGGKFEPAGVVHRGEFVFSKEATQGNEDMLEDWHRRLRGYWAGGTVGLPGYAGGGRVKGGGSWVNDMLERRMKALNKAIKQTTKTLERERKVRDDVVSKQQALSSSVTNSLRGDIFGQPTSAWGGGSDWKSRLATSTTNANQFTSLTGKLKAAGLSGEALDALLSQGSTDLLAEFAAMDKASLRKYAADYMRYTQATSRAGSFAGAAAHGAAASAAHKEQRETNQELKALNKELKKTTRAAEQTANKLAKAINGASAKGQRNRR